MQKILKILKAISSETRLKIIKELLKNPKCAKDLSSCIQRDISTISRHLEILENADLIEIKRSGKKISVKIKNPPILKKLLKILEEMGNESL